jgi:hypothetical protein
LLPAPATVLLLRSTATLAAVRRHRAVRRCAKIDDVVAWLIDDE